MLIKKARNVSELGMTTADWHTEFLDEAPQGYGKALSEGTDLVDVAAGSPALELLAAAGRGDVAPRYCLRLTPRTTLGLGMVLGMVLEKSLVPKWTVLGPLEQTIKRLGVDSVETLALHREGLRMSFPFWAYDAAVQAYQQGLCMKVGVSHPNLNMEVIKRTSEELQRRGAALSCAFVPLSLLDRRNLPLVQECRSLGVQVYATSPLGADGLGSGRYTVTNPTGGEISLPRFTLAQLAPLRPLHEALASAAARARQRTEKPVDTTQVALQWVRSKGASPLCGVATARDAKALMGCGGWALAEAEVALLDAAADELDKGRPRVWG